MVDVVDKESIVLIEGAVPAISTAIQAPTKEGDAVLIKSHQFIRPCSFCPFE